MNQRDQKNYNQLRILNILRSRPGISQADISALLALRPSTVSNLIRDLKAAGMVTNVGKGDSGSSGGKKADLLSLHSGDQDEVDKVIMPLVTALATIALCEFYAAIGNCFDGPYVDAVGADHFHVGNDLMFGHGVSFRLGSTHPGSPAYDASAASLEARQEFVRH